MPIISKVGEFRKAIRGGAVVWPGLYPIAFVAADMQWLCWHCADENRRLVIENIASPLDREWEVVAYYAMCDVDEAVICAHCNAVVQEDDAVDGPVEAYAADQDEADKAREAEEADADWQGIYSIHHRPDE